MGTKCDWMELFLRGFIQYVNVLVREMSGVKLCHEENFNNISLEYVFRSVCRLFYVNVKVHS